MAFRRGRGIGGYMKTPHNGMGRMQGEGMDAMFNTNLTGPASGNRVMSTLGPTGGPAGGRTSFANYGPVLEARRQARLGAMDAGLSTRGRVGAPGRGGRAATRGLESRGARPMPGTRMKPAPMLGPGRSEYYSARRANITSNVQRSRAARGGLSGSQAADVKFGAMHGPTRMDLNKVEARAVNRPRRQAAISRAKAISDSRKSPLRPSPVLDTAGNMGSNVPAKAANMNKNSNLIKMFKETSNSKKLAIGAGVIGLGALLGRRKDRGTSSGSSGAYR